MSELTGYTAEKVFYEHSQMTRHCVCAACETFRQHLNHAELTRLQRIEAAARYVVTVCEDVQEISSDGPAIDALRQALGDGRE